MTETQFRQTVLQKFIQHQALDFMFATVEQIAKIETTVEVL